MTNDLAKSISLQPGQIVLTAFGVGVITKVRENLYDVASDAASDAANEKAKIIQVRLWRMPFKSVASTSVAFLQKDTILKSLEAAPGMTAYAILDEDENDKPSKDGAKEAQVMIHCYFAHSDTYLISVIHSNANKNEDNKEINGDSLSPKDLIEIKSSQLRQTNSSKFYPLIEDLMARADQAVAATSSLVSKASLSSLVTKSTEMINSTDQIKVPINEEKIDLVSNTIQTKLQNLQTVDEQQIMQVYNMLKDEELTSLLQKGQERLKQLVADEIPHALTSTLKQSGIEINTTDSTNTLMLESRKKALTALNNLLDQNSLSNAKFEEIKSALGTEFSNVFDSLSTAAKSDRSLNAIFDTISEKTSQWQEATGRLKATKSASLFIEGTQRLKARAATLLSPEQLLKAKDLRMRFTKAFMEGDAAVARLKSIELGDEIRSRLVKMIELRSGSQGGLDGMIAGALTSFSDKTSDKVSKENIQMMVLQLQKTASTSTKTAHESLLGALSRQSQFREAAILRIENVLKSLESQLGSDISADEIAKIARGEGGTSALFEPIARRASKEIESQLDVLESKLTDPVSLSVLAKTREIITGEMTLNNLMDEAVTVLNDEKIVAHGEKLVQYGESVLDAIEKGSSNKDNVVGGVMQIVEKAGLSKDSLMRNVENLDINRLLNDAESAVTNEEARKEMISSAGDAALDFLLRILPSMSVPPFDGVKDGLVYHLSNISMKGFKVKKENIMVEIAGIRATKHLEKQETSTTVNNSASEDENIPFMDFPRNRSVDSQMSNQSGVTSGSGETTKDVKATEVLIIDVKNISAIVEDAIWSFEQTFFPYLKGKGKSYVNLSDGSIRLQFELRKRRTNLESGENALWEPVLCLHDQSCKIDQIELKLLGEGRIIWVLNKIATYLKSPLRDYVVRTIKTLLKKRSGLLLKRLNDTLKNFWGIILKTSGLVLDDLEEISESDLIDAIPEENANEIELVWREHLPLGLNLLLNDESGLLKVVDFPRGSQARKVAIERNLDPDIFKSSTIMAVNGFRYQASDQADLVDALRDPSRPKSISFELANAADAERVQAFANVIKTDDNQDKGALEADSENSTATTYSLEVLKIEDEGPIGIRFSDSADGLSLRIDEFLKGDDEQPQLAKQNEKLAVNDILISINEVYVYGENKREMALREFQAHSLTRPLSLTFAKPYLHFIVLNKDDNKDFDDKDPSEEFRFYEKKSENINQIYLKEFLNVSGVVESSGVYLGDHLVKINEDEVGLCASASEGNFSTNSFEDVIAKLEDSSIYPVTLQFARPSKEKSKRDASVFELESAETIELIVNSRDQLGCQFGKGQEINDIIVTSFDGVPGAFQKHIRFNNINPIKMVVESVNGQVVPSYANANMVLSAIKTSWSRNGSVEILFSDEQRKNWLKSIVNSK